MSAAVALTLHGLTCGASGAARTGLVPTVVRTLVPTVEPTVDLAVVRTVEPLQPVL